MSVLAMNRRKFAAFAAGATTTAFAGPVWSATDDNLVVGDDGLHKQPWFLDTFLDFGEDLTEAADQGKGLLVLFEQRGCPYCHELHRVNFAKQQLSDYLQEHFNSVQINLFGSRETTDFDGETLEERNLAFRWGIHFTPTTVLFPSSAAGSQERAEAEAFRMPGYLKPFHYLSALEFVAEEKYQEVGFQRYLQAKFKDLAAKGIEPDVW